MIHDEKFFQKEEILRRAKQYQFPDPIAVVYFLWDCELCAQLQSICDCLILKGGAATQLHLPLEKQRGSKDIDIVTSLDLKDIPAIMNKLTEKMDGKIRFKQYGPKNPTSNIPLLTYLVYVPSYIDENRKELEVKIDFLCNCLPLNSENLVKVQTYAVETQTIKCLTAGTLLGDKLLSLAKGSIGMTFEDYYPKQIYDVDALIQSGVPSEPFFDDAIRAVSCLVVSEAGYRQIVVEPPKVMEDIVRVMERYSLVDMPQGESELKKVIDNFQQFYVNNTQRVNRDGWSIKALRIRFFTGVISLLLEKKISKEEAVQLVSRSQAVEQLLENIFDDDVLVVKGKMLALQREKMLGFKILRGKSLQRVFWQILTIDRLTELEAIVKSKIK